eukprot:240523-Prorocentrum_minimum.AAC.1
MTRPMFYQKERAELLDYFCVWFTLMLTGDDDEDDEEFCANIHLGMGFLGMLSMERSETCSVPRLYLTFDKIAHLDLRTLYRFDYSGLRRLLVALQIPDFTLSGNGANFSREEALLVLLARIHSPTRYEELKVDRFGGSVRKLSEVYNLLVSYLYDTWAQPLLTNLRRSVQHFERWAEAICQKSGAIGNCVGFSDGTLNRCARPTVWQRMLYSGHKRDHGLKYLHCTSPDGLTYVLWGPDFNVHDSTMVGHNGLLEEMEEIREELEVEEDFTWYADAAFTLSRFCITGVRRNDPLATQEERDWTGRMNRDRTSVEWTIGKAKTTFAGITDKKQQKVLLQALGKQYFVATLLTNCHTCLYGSLTSEMPKIPIGYTGDVLQRTL